MSLFSNYIKPVNRIPHTVNTSITKKVVALTLPSQRLMFNQSLDCSVLGVKVKEKFTRASLNLAKMTQIKQKIIFYQTLLQLIKFISNSMQKNIIKRHKIKTKQSIIINCLAYFLFNFYWIFIT